MNKYKLSSSQRVKVTCPVCGDQDVFVGRFGDRTAWKLEHNKHSAGGMFKIEILKFEQVTPPPIDEDELVGGAYDDMTGEKL